MPVNNSLTFGNGSIFSGSVSGQGGSYAACLIGGLRDPNIYQIREISAGLSISTGPDLGMAAADWQGNFRSPAFRLSVLLGKSIKADTTNSNFGVVFNAASNFSKDTYDILFDQMFYTWNVFLNFSPSMEDGERPGFQSQPNYPLIVIVTGMAAYTNPGGIVSNFINGFLNVRAVQKRQRAQSTKVAGEYRLGDI